MPRYMTDPLQMLIETLRAEGVTDEKVLAAMAVTDRAEFVLDEYRSQAYDNAPLPIGFGQTISQPLVVGLMTQALQLEPESKVLEVGTGSGYQAAILARLSSEVITVERVPELAQRAAAILARLGLTNVKVRTGSAAAGWPEEAPYDRILITAGAPRLPVRLLARLRPGGRLVVPVGSLRSQRLLVIEKGSQGIKEHDLGAVQFVPLIGEGAWTS